jgi:hypothetical protein
MKALLREAVAVAVVSGLVFQSLRHWVADRYVVPSNSMQPCLFGADRGGDVVLVNKLARVDDLRRYDLGVFRQEGTTTDLVKRVASLGGEWVEVRDGDLWCGPSPQQLERAMKHPLECRDLRVRWLQWPPEAGAPAEPLEPFMVAPRSADGLLQLPAFAAAADARRECTELRRRAARERDEAAAGDSPLWLSTARVIDATYLDAQSCRGTEGQSIVVDDFGADLWFAPARSTALLLAIDLRPDSWLLYWELRTGRRELWRNGETVATCAVPVAALAVGSGPVRVEFGHLDGRFFHAVSGDSDGLWTVPMRSEWLTADPGPTAWPLQKNRFAAAVVGPEAAALTKLLLFRDLHWFRPQLEIGMPTSQFVAAKHVPEGSVYLLGDNSVDSRDSRMFGPMQKRSFVGRPHAVLGPWPRSRVLPR